MPQKVYKQLNRLNSLRNTNEYIKQSNDFGQAWKRS